ncbi:MAG: hypothetical protein SO179_03400 [Bacteroidales bacterium]|nr:hypothetical protein [Bacteroidales bacterium]
MEEISKQDILIYQNKEGNIKLDVHLQDETVWLNRQQIANLFNRDVKTIGKHINNVFEEGELDKNSVVAKFATSTKIVKISSRILGLNINQ